MQKGPGRYQSICGKMPLVCRDQDEAVSSGVVKNAAVAEAGKPVSKRTLRLSKQIAQ